MAKSFLVFFTTLFSLLFNVRFFFFFWQKPTYFENDAFIENGADLNYYFAFLWKFKSIKITQITAKRNFCRQYTSIHTNIHLYIHTHFKEIEILMIKCWTKNEMSLWNLLPDNGRKLRPQWIDAFVNTL